MSTVILRTVDIGNRQYVIEKPSFRKVSRVLAMLRELSNEAAGLQQELSDYIAEYSRTRVQELDRVQAKMMVSRPLLTDDDGELILHPETGEPQVVPSPLDLLTEEDWQAAGNVWRRPASPTTEEIITAMFGAVWDVAESRIQKIVAAVTLSNVETSSAWRGNYDEAISARAEELSELHADEWLDLAVTAAEVILEFVVDSRDNGMGERVGKLRSKWQARKSEEPTPAPSPESESGHPSSTPTSSTDSPSPTDGHPTPDSISPSTSDAPSSNASPEMKPSEPASEPPSSTE